MEERLLKVFGQPYGLHGRSGGFLGESEDDGRVRVPDVPLAAMGILLRGSFLELVPGIHRTVTLCSHLGRPSSVRNVVFNGEVESGPFRSSLTTADDDDVPSHHSPSLNTTG